MTRTGGRRLYRDMPSLAAVVVRVVLDHQDRPAAPRTGDRFGLQVRVAAVVGQDDCAAIAGFRRRRVGRLRRLLFQLRDAGFYVAHASLTPLSPYRTFTSSGAG